MDEIIVEAIKQCQNVILPIGTIVAHLSEETALKLIEYRNDLTICLRIDGRKMEFPASEIFDVNKVKRIAEKIYQENIFKRRKKSEKFMKILDLNL